MRSLRYRGLGPTSFEFYSSFFVVEGSHLVAVATLFLACGGLVRSLRGLRSVHMNVATLDASIGVFLERFGALYEGFDEPKIAQIVNIHFRK
jgi:hypothetical protein